MYTDNKICQVGGDMKQCKQSRALCQTFRGVAHNPVRGVFYASRTRKRTCACTRAHEHARTPPPHMSAPRWMEWAVPKKHVLTHAHTLTRTAACGPTASGAPGAIGNWSCGNHDTLVTDLKGRLGFEGYVMSDWGATHSTSMNEGNAGKPQPRAGCRAQAHVSLLGR